METDSITKARELREKAHESRIAAVLAILRERHPKCFAPQPIPIKIGIHMDLVAEFAGSTEDLSSALRQYTGSEKYLLAMREGAVRVDLHGANSGAVSKEEAEFAANLHKFAVAERVAAEIKAFKELANVGRRGPRS